MDIVAEARRAPGVMKLNHTHEAIARWLVENPTESLGKCAQHFGYTQAWLSCIIHSDAFQAKLQQLQAEADGVVILDVPARLRGLAAASLDGLAQQVDHALSEGQGNGVLHRQFLKDTAELTLRSLGYGVAKAPAVPAGSTHFHNHQHAHVTVAKSVVDEAREKLLGAHVQKTVELPAGGSSDPSPVQRLASPVSAPGTPEGSETSRSDISGQGGSVSE